MGVDEVGECQLLDRLRLLTPDRVLAAIDEVQASATTAPDGAEDGSLEPLAGANDFVTTEDIRRRLKGLF